MAVKRESFLLTNDNIDLISDIILNEMSEYRIPKANQIKTRLSLEEALLRMQAHFGTNEELVLTRAKRLGRHFIDVRLKGDAYNPLRFSENENEELDMMLSYSDYQPDYYYFAGTNIIRWSVPSQKMHPAVYYSAAILLGLIAGSLINAVPLNESPLEWILGFLGTVETIWIRLLNVLCGPVVFLLIITTVLNMDSITRQGENTTRFIMRVFRVSMISAAAAAAVCILSFRNLDFSGIYYGSKHFFDLLLQLFPEDAVSPFMSSNVPQLLLLGLVLGNAMIASGKRYDKIADIVHEANSIGLYIAGWMSNAAPFFISLLLAYEIIRHNTRIYTEIWKPVLILIVVSVLIMSVFTLLTARAEHIRPATIVKALRNPFVKTIKSGSPDPVLDLTLKNCTDILGIDRRYAEVGLTIGLVMYMPVSAAATLIFGLYTAGMYGVHASIMWYAIAVIVSVAMSVAVPPVPGVGILTYVVMFANLGIPSQALISAMIFDILTNVVISAANQYMLQLELIVSADRMAMIDHSKLRGQN